MLVCLYISGLVPILYGTNQFSIATILMMSHMNVNQSGRLPVWRLGHVNVILSVWLRSV